MKIAVLTDLHAFAEKDSDKAPSWLALGEDQGNTRSNPFAALRALVQQAALTADLVVCCGDMGDKASPEGQQYVWREIDQLKNVLGAELAVGTAGNHDLDSRFKYTSYDARGQIQALAPPFPIDDDHCWLEYWARNYTTFEKLGCRFVLLNSAAYHGYVPVPEKPEFDHGRVSDRTIDSLINQLKDQGRRDVNILICHHHPFKNDLIRVADYSQMENGDRLINELAASRSGPWLIIHGHKHLPRLFYAPGGNSSPTIFSAGSFSAKLYPEYLQHARNEFYIVEVMIPNSPATTVRGRVECWQWSYGNGWVPARSGQGMGPGAAFGTRADTADLARDLADALKAGFSGRSAKWVEMVELKPSIEFLIPEDLAVLLDLLQDSYGIRLIGDFESGAIAEVQVP